MIWKKRQLLEIGEPSIIVCLTKWVKFFFSVCSFFSKVGDTVQCLTHKVQLLLKADWRAMEMNTNLFCLHFYSSWQTNQIGPFVFWENLQRANLLFGFIWPLAIFSNFMLSLNTNCYTNLKSVFLCRGYFPGIWIKQPNFNICSCK